MVTSNELNLTS